MNFNLFCRIVHFGKNDFSTLVTSSDVVALPITKPIATQDALRTNAFSSLISVVIMLDSFFLLDGDKVAGADDDRTR